MASDTVQITVEKLKATPTDVIASYEGTHSIAMGQMTMDFELSLDVYADGTYEFSAMTDGEESASETGFIGIENMMSLSGILLPDGMSTPADITIGDDGSISASFSMGAGARQPVTLTPVAA